MIASILGQCSECCECPEPTLESEVRASSASACGILGPDDVLYRWATTACNPSTGTRTFSYLVDDVSCEIKNITADYPECCTNYFYSGGVYYRTKVSTYNFDYEMTTNVICVYGSTPIDPVLDCTNRTYTEYYVSTDFNAPPTDPPVYPEPSFKVESTGNFVWSATVSPEGETPCVQDNSFSGDTELTCTRTDASFYELYDSSTPPKLVEIATHIRGVTRIVYDNPAVVDGVLVWDFEETLEVFEYDTLGSLIAYQAPTVTGSGTGVEAAACISYLCGDDFLTETFSTEVAGNADYGDPVDLAQQLQNQLTANRPAWANLFDSSISEVNGSVSEDLSSAYSQQLQYRFRFKAPLVGTGKCYIVLYDVKYTATDDSTVTVPMSWQWASGDIPDDYDQFDAETWPVSTVQTIETGTYYIRAEILNIRSSCRDCEETSNTIPIL